MFGKGLNYRVFYVCIGLALALIHSTYASRAGAETREETDQKEILIIGNANILDDNIAAARKAAISEALTKGVEAYLARRLGSQGMINNFSRLIHDVIPGSGDEIENFQILTEERLDREYKVLIGIKVNEKLMEEKLKDMGILLREGPPIRLLFMISQKKTQEGETSSYWWSDPDSSGLLTPAELVLHRVFQERGFIPVNRLSNFPEEKLTPGMRGLHLSDNEVAAWGELLSADFVIFGESEIIDNQAVYLVLKVLDVEKQSVVAQDSHMENITEDPQTPDKIMNAMTRSANSVAAGLSPQIIQSYNEIKEQVNTLQIELRGLGSFEQLKMFKDFLKGDIPEANSVTQTRIRGNAVTFLVEFQGTKDLFLKKMNDDKKFPFPADIIPTEMGEIIIQIK